MCVYNIVYIYLVIDYCFAVTESSYHKQSSASGKKGQDKQSQEDLGYLKMNPQDIEHARKQGLVSLM